MSLKLIFLLIIRMVIKMNENLELLEYLYKNSEMGVSTLTKMLDELQDKENKIKLWASEAIKEYEKFYKKSSELIKKYKMDVKGNSLMSKMGSNMGIKMEVMKDNSDSAMAHMIIEGVTMGLVDIETKINNFSDVVDGKILSLAIDYKEALKKQLETLKKYL